MNLGIFTTIPTTNACASSPKASFRITLSPSTLEGICIILGFLFFGNFTKKVICCSYRIKPLNNVILGEKSKVKPPHESMGILKIKGFRLGNS